MHAADAGAGRRVQLHRALSKLGLCSRAVAAGLVRAGMVRVNGRVARDPLAWVDLDADRVEADGAGPGRASGGPHEPLLLALHKPRGYVTTRSDERGRATVYDLLPAEHRGRWLFPVGRLDRDSEGLLLFTDDGALAHRLTAPDAHVEKVYRVLLDRELTAHRLHRFAAGVVVGGRRTLPAGIEPEGGRWYRVRLREGRNRQIRRMAEALGARVERLVRVAVGPFSLDGLEPGEARAERPSSLLPPAGAVWQSGAKQRKGVAP